MSEIITPKIYNVDRYVLASVLHKPAGKGPFPSVILIHGFSGYKDEANIVALAEELAAKGYVAIRFDTTGSGDSEGTIHEDYRISTFMNDIDTVANYLKHQDFVQSSAIGLWGHSMGGMLAVLYASEYSDAKAVAIVSAPAVMGAAGWLAGELPEWEKKGVLEVETETKGTISVPWAFMKEAKSYSALEAAKELKQPILTILGLADTVTPPAETRSIYDAVSGEKKLVEIDGMEHDYKANPAMIKRVNEEVMAFFDLHLK